jgi:hypothetical protein
LDGVRSLSTPCGAVWPKNRAHPRRLASRVLSANLGLAERSWTAFLLYTAFFPAFNFAHLAR